MTKEQINPADRLKAMVLAAGSATINRVKGLNHRLLDNGAPSHVDAQWMFAASGVTGNGTARSRWARANGIQESGRLAKEYKQIGLIGMRASSLDALVDRSPSAVKAVAYQLNTATMVAALPKGVTFGSQPELPDTYLFGMGIGKGVLWAAGGLWHPGDNSFEIPVDPQLAVHGIYDAKAFPAHIPTF